jgi:hypothetical protein
MKNRLCKLEKKGDEIKKKFFSSETTVPISTKLCWDDPWVVPFQKCVRQCRPVSKMATMTKNRNFFKKGNNSKMGNQIYLKIAG